MKTRVSVLAALALLVACESSTAPDPAVADADVLVEEVLTALTGGSDTRQTDRQGVLHRLLRRTLQVVATEHGTDAARTAASRLRELAQAVRIARAGDDREAFQEALLAFETAEAQLVVRVLGTDPVVRLLRSDGPTLERLRARAERVEASGGDAARLRRILRATAPDYRLARQALGDGDAVTALRLAARVHDLLVRFLD